MKSLVKALDKTEIVEKKGQKRFSSIRTTGYK